MLGYNMFAYCYNNPVNYIDYTGENAEAIAAFFGGLWTVAFAEPTPAGEIVAGIITVVTVVVGAATVGHLLEEASGTESSGTESSESKPDDPPQSVPDNSKVPDSQLPDVEYPGDDPTVAPDGYEWTGPDPQGGKRGGYKNKDPNTRDSWHPDFHHGEPKGPHWDFNDIFGKTWAVTSEQGHTVIRLWEGKKIILTIVKF